MNEFCIWRCFDFKDSSLKIFEAFKDKPYVFFLDSSLKESQLSRFSFIGFDPFLVLRGKNDSPFKRLRELLCEYNIPAQRGLPPFFAGAVGFLSYDLGFQLERIARQTQDDLNLSDYFFGFYDAAIVIDRKFNKLYVFSSGLPEKNVLLAKKRANFRYKEIMDTLNKIELSNNYRKPLNFNYDSFGFSKDELGLEANFTKANYLKAVEKALNYIREGDIYQVNLSQRFSMDLGRLESESLGLDLYKILRLISPSSFAGYLDCGNFQIISSSPERFLSLRERIVQTRPMKGTRKRSNNRIEDLRLKNELLNSPKERAELLMITDLERNDLGKVCDYGSVRVRHMRTLEEYSTVYQTTSTVTGILHKDKDRIDLIKACFPGGSITGCPKIRSMEIIEELEPTRRSIYTGSLGYLSFSGEMDLNILIRTLLLKGNKVYFQVGGGIVADSCPEDEYEETLVKAKAMLNCLNKVLQDKLAVCYK